MSGSSVVLALLTAVQGMGGADRLGWHIVRPGETLQNVTLRYLGSSERWRENWRLNPALGNPDQLTPGQRIRVIVGSAASAAEIRALSRRVDARPFPQPWLSAQEGDRLRQRDGLRTHEAASAELRFEDGSLLQVGEQSVVFIGTVAGTAAGGRSIEVVDGQADVRSGVASSRSSKSREIEIVMGPARARARAKDGSAHARARRLPAGTAQIMMYEGSADLASGGSSVAVPEGMGAAAARGRPPGPAEPLLPAPEPLVPRPGAALDHANPLFAWRAVPGAAGYVLEVCRDRGCAVVERKIGTSSTDAVLDALPSGTGYWRINARSPSALDGYSSEPRELSITSRWRRRHGRREASSTDP